MERVMRGNGFSGIKKKMINGDIGMMITGDV